MSEKIEDQGYYDQDRPGDERSLYADMHRSRDFGEWTRYGERRLYGTEELCQLKNYWNEQLDNPERSPRARIEIGKLVVRAGFEIDSRQSEHTLLSQRQIEEDLAWDEYVKELA